MNSKTLKTTNKTVNKNISLKKSNINNKFMFL